MRTFCRPHGLSTLGEMEIAGQAAAIVGASSHAMFQALAWAVRVLGADRVLTLAHQAHALFIAGARTRDGRRRRLPDGLLLASLRTEIGDLRALNPPREKKRRQEAGMRTKLYPHTAEARATQRAIMASLSDEERQALAEDLAASRQMSRQRAAERRALKRDRRRIMREQKLQRAAELMKAGETAETAAATVGLGVTTCLRLLDAPTGT